MRWAILGLGNIAKKFAKTINSMENEILYALGSRDINKALEFNKEFNALKCYGSYEELLNDNNIDVVYISTPNNMHYENALMALNNDKNVLLEKPFTTNPNDAKKLYDLAKEKGLFIMEALWIRFLPLYKKLKKLLKSNIIGNVKDVSVSYGFDTNPERKKRKFDSNLAGGALLDIGIYNIGLLDMIIDSKIESFESKYHINEYNTDDYSEIYFKYKNGTKAKSILSIGKDIDREVFIEGEKGSIYIPDFQHATKFILRIDKKEEEYNFPFIINGFEYQINEVINSINKGLNESIIYGSNDSIRLMTILYDIRKNWNMKFNFEK